MKVKIQEFTVKEINIDGDIFTLKDYGNNSSGKLTVEIAYGSTFSAYWGSMGSSLEGFICRCDVSYLKGCLRAGGLKFSPKKTLKNIRAKIREEIPYYRFREAQKQLREDLKKLENYDDRAVFHSELSHLVERISEQFNDSSEDSFDKKEAIETLDNIDNYFWNYSDIEATGESIYMTKILKNLQTVLKGMTNENI